MFPSLTDIIWQCYCINSKFYSLLRESESPKILPACMHPRAAAHLRSDCVSSAGRGGAGANQFGRIEFHVDRVASLLCQGGWLGAPPTPPPPPFDCHAPAGRVDGAPIMGRVRLCIYREPCRIPHCPASLLARSSGASSTTTPSPKGRCFDPANRLLDPNACSAQGRHSRSTDVYGGLVYPSFVRRSPWELSFFGRCVWCPCSFLPPRPLSLRHLKQSLAKPGMNDRARHACCCLRDAGLSSATPRANLARIPLIWRDAPMQVPS